MAALQLQHATRWHLKELTRHTRKGAVNSKSAELTRSTEGPHTTGNLSDVDFAFILLVYAAFATTGMRCNDTSQA